MTLQAGESADTLVTEAETQRRAKLASEIEHLAGRSPRWYWALTISLLASAIVLLIWSVEVNRQVKHGDTATLQILLQILGFLAAIFASFAFTRTLTKPGELFARHAAATLPSAEQLRTAVIDLVRDVKAAEDECNNETVLALLKRLRERIVQHVGAANANVEQWFIVKQASTSRPSPLELDEFVSAYRIVQQQRILLLREIYGAGSSPPPSLVISETLFAEDFVDEWLRGAGERAGEGGDL